MSPAVGRGVRPRGRRRSAPSPVRLMLAAVALVGLLASVMYVAAPASAAETPPQVGEIATFRVGPADQRASLAATVRFVGDDSVIYVEKGRSVPISLISSLAATIDDVVYPRLTEALGPEPRPGIDGASRLVVLVYDFQDPQLFGYFDPRDVDPWPADDPESNRREMFYLNLTTLLGDPSRAAAAASHELAHMILYHRDYMLDPSPARSPEAIWVEEGIAMYAEHLAGFGAESSDFLRSFELQSDKNLTKWTGGFWNDYGASLSFMAYLVERAGPGFLRDLVGQPLDGIAGIDAVLAARGSFDTFASMFDDRVIADFLDGRPPSAPPWVHQTLELAVEPVAVSGLAPWVGSGLTKNYAAAYLDLPRTASTSSLRVVVDGQDGAPLRAALVSWDSGGVLAPVVTPFALQPASLGGTVTAAPGHDRHTLVVWARGPESVDLAYGFRYSAAVDPVGTVQFLDVGSSHPFFPYIDPLRESGVVSGREVPPGSGLWYYRSDDRVLRAQFAKMAVTAVGLHTEEVESLGSPTFSDVPLRLDGQGRPEPYPYDYVEEAVAAGIVGGYSDGTFRPYDDMMRIHLVRMLLRAAAAAGSPLEPYVGGEAVFADVPPGSPLYGDVMTAYVHGIMSGSMAGGVRTFAPWGPATRGHVAKMTANLLAFLDDGGE